jgi:hypothetical protein
MKKFILIATGAALILAACNSNPKTNAEDPNAAKVTYADTVGFAAFQQWKLQNELQNAEAYNQQQAAPVQEHVVYRTVYRDRPSSSSTRSSGTNRTSTSSSGSSTSSSGTGTTTTTQKKGISKAAKGAAIGAVGGAVVGAVINKKNRAVGGVVGGVLGGVVGYGIGRQMDKKDGRYLTPVPISPIPVSY